MSFCIDSSSRRLSNQYLIRDHMAVHYNKILSAKEVGKMPISLFISTLMIAFLIESEIFMNLEYILFSH
uniref:Spermatosis associated 7 n=1 Tax=Pseudonaja textilis TaxID=8673 RepID=A0A670YCS3_PSETE